MTRWSIFTGMAMALQFLASVALAAPDCSRGAGSLPDDTVTAGTDNPDIPIEHIVIVMQENRSFDEYFGRLNQEAYYGDAVDGIKPGMENPKKDGTVVPVYHTHNLCTPDIEHGWDAMHRAWDKGRMDGFVLKNPERAMSYYDQSELPYYYALADQFAIADRYFCSAITQTYPNRYFLVAATAFGQVKNVQPHRADAYSQKTIVDALDQYGVTWRYYASKENYLKLFRPLAKRDAKKMRPLSEYKKDLKNGKLAQVTFIESSEDKGEDEHPANDVRVGQAWVGDKLSALMRSPYWEDSVFFLTYDENGGFFDHVPPPEACAPDDIKPTLDPREQKLPGGYGHYGMRVPFVVVSPYAKHHYVSHVVHDHTSMLKFIETKFNLPALTRRDANADALLDMFDFKKPIFGVKPLPDVGTVKDLLANGCPTRGQKL